MMDPKTDYCSLLETMMPSTFEEYASKKDWYDYMRNSELLVFLDEALKDQKQIKDGIEDIRDQGKSQGKSKFTFGVVIGTALGIGVTLVVRKLIKTYKKRRAPRGK